MNNIWFTSDPHAFHKNIVRGVSNWRDENRNPSPGPRDFDTLEEHNQALIDNINNNVRENDTLYCTGDWSFGGVGSIWDFRKQLRVKTIHLILGNHDHNIHNNRTLPNVYQDDNTGKFVDGTPDPATFRLEVKAKEIFTSVQQQKTKKICGEMFFMSHCAHRVWPQGEKGVIHLYGHSHNSLPDYTSPDGKKYRTMDIGVDCHPEFRPYNIDEIFEIMKDRIPLGVDYHTGNR